MQKSTKTSHTSTMADSVFASQSNRPFFLTSLAGPKSNPIIPEAFFASYLEDNDDFSKLKLTSDAYDKTWEVKLNGRRFSSGWEDFSADHYLRDDDVLVFRHNGGMAFHVTRKSSTIQTKSSSSGGDDDESEDSNEDEDESEIETSDANQESEKSGFLRVTTSNLRLNRVSLPKHFAIANGLSQRWCEIDLMNQSGKSWTLSLRHNKYTGQDYILGGWRSFCRTNELKPGFYYRFELVKNGTKPLLRWLCSDTIPVGNGKVNVSKKTSSEGTSGASMKQNKFLKINLKSYMFKSGQLRFSGVFARDNCIKEAGEITLVGKNGVKWPVNLVSGTVNGQFYMAKGWKKFCAANGLKTGDTFTLEFVRGKGKAPPMLKLCSKAKVKNSIQKDQAPLNGHEEEETKTRVQKRARSSTPRETRASNKRSASQETVKRKQPLQPCKITDQVAKAKQSLVDALTSSRRDLCELEIKEHNLEVLLQEINVLGEKLLEINNII